MSDTNPTTGQGSTPGSTTPQPGATNDTVTDDTVIDDTVTSESATSETVTNGSLNDQSVNEETVHGSDAEAAGEQASTAQAGTAQAGAVEEPQSGDLLDAEPAEQPADAQSTSEQVAGDGEVVDHSESARVGELQAQVQDLTGDLKRTQAEYINYKRRVDRDKHLQRGAGIEAVLVDLLPVLDDLRTARQHEELSGGFKLLAEELAKVTRKYGLEAYGEKGDPFDPQIHEALMQAPQPGITEPVCLDIMQLGYRHNDRVLRAARVAVAVPADESAE